MNNLNNLTTSNVIPPITNQASIDERIWQLAQARGYRRQPGVSDTSLLVTVDGQYYLQPAAADAWHRLKQVVAAAQLGMYLRSAYRDYDEQRRLLLARLNGRYDDASIQTVLAQCAPPGYSKHHSGYTIDIAEWPEGPRFIETDLYTYLSHNDFAVIKSCSFAPSYPADSPPQGPEPEAWEFVYCGD